MSHNTVELSTLQPPEPIVKLPLGRHGSQASSFISAPDAVGNDTQPLASLARTDTQHTITSKSRTTAIIASVTLITAISTLLNGLTTVALPTIANELDIPEGLLLWPTSIQALTNGCSLLLSGSIADALGSRFMYLVGCILQAASITACGLSKTGAQIIVFRGLSGIAISFCLPSAVAIITRSFVGKRRDLAFAAMGGGQPIGFAVGLTVGGVFTDTIGWRWGFFVSAFVDMALFAVALWGLPKAIDRPADAERGLGFTWAQKLERLKNDIDWVGAAIASTSLALLSFVLATLAGSDSAFDKPANIAMLSVALTLIPVFIWWVGRQEKRGLPAIIPNSLWRNRIFTTICIAVFFTWGSFNAVETILTFYFQKVQLLSALDASIRFLPAPVSGAISNIVIGLIVHRVSANWLVVGGCLISSLSPLVMAFATQHSSYWSTAFLANSFNPVGADTLFTIANLLITSVFPAKTQALAGGVFNTISQIGKSVGLALVAVIAASVTADAHYEVSSSPEALLKGYNATFWFSFALIIATCLISLWGLRQVGKVGHKRD